MAKRPLTKAAVAHPLSDLLFSPRAAFIWNHTRKSVAWMNPAARAAFALRLEDFSAAIPASLIRRFEHFVGRKASGVAKVKIAGAPGIHCTIELLKLADGQDGLIVAETEAEAKAGVASSKASKEPEKTVRKPRVGSARRGRKTPKVSPALTAGEMRAFKAVGRKVRRLCVEKEKAKAPPAPPAAAPSPLGRTAQLADILAGFDLVLFLDEDLRILSLKGYPSRLGWPKAKIAGKSAGDLLLPNNRAILRRMVKRVRGQAARSAKGALVVSGETGKPMPCRGILARWEEGGASFFLAFISLEPPARLKRVVLTNGVAAKRLAA